MRFVLDLWPEGDETDPIALLTGALDSIANVEGLAWDIEDDEGNMLHRNVVVR
jgi:hypothetical protein